jgi:uncharacterized SAM-binding protein YcdF (DUF218 family)
MTTRRTLRLLGLPLLAALLAFGAGFGGFVVAAYRAALPPPEADGIVALTGGADRVETALRLLAAGQARLLLVSGVAHGAALATLARRVDLDPTPLSARVTLGHAATSTLGNAEETAEWARTHGLHSLIVVTAGYHMPRAMLDLRRAMPEETLYPMPVQPEAMRHRAMIRLLAGEYVKLLAAWLGVSHLVPHAAATAAGQPVGKSVSG